jgi:tyrosine-protein kinase Etk/Wzc
MDMEKRNDAASERSLWEGLSHYWSIIWKHRFLVAIVCGAGTLCVVAFCLASVLLPPDKSPLPNLYTAQATILIEGSGQGDLASSILTALGADQSKASSIHDNGDMIIEILHSRMILDQLITEFNLSEKYHITKDVKGNTRLAFLNQLGIDYARNAGSMKISYEDTDPNFAKDIVNRTVSLLDEWFSLNRGQAKQKQRQILEEKINEVKSTIANLQSRIKKLQTEYGVLDVQGLSQSQAAAIASLRSQLILKEIDIMNYSSFSKIDDPRLEQLKGERQNLLDLIAQNQLALPATSQAGGDDKSGAGQKNLLDVAQSFSQLNIELDIQQRIYNTLSPQYEAMKLAPESEQAFQVLELADTPDLKSGPIRSRIVFVGFAASLGLGVVAAFILNFINSHKHQTLQRGS